MIKACLVLFTLILFKEYNSKIDIPIDSTSANKYPYKLFQPTSTNSLDLLIPLQNGNCFFLFHFISYSIVYFKKYSDQKDIKVNCVYKENEKQVDLTLMDGPTENLITLKSKTMYSEVKKEFWFQGENNPYTNIASFLQIENINKNLNQLHFLHNDTEKEGTIIQSVSISTDIMHFEHFMFKNLFIKEASLFGYLCILIGLFIATFGSLFHRTTAGLNAIFFLIGFISEITEPLFPSGMYTESLGLLIIIGTALVGIFAGWLIILKKNIEKAFYGAMLGFVLFKILSYCYLLINFNGFSGEKILIDFFWLVVAALFGFLYFSLYNNQLSFIISTCIVGSYMIVYGYNLFLGGYLEDTLVFKIRQLSRELNDETIYSEFRKIWNNSFVVMYFSVWVCLSFAFFLMQTYLRYRREMEKPMSEQRGLFRSVHVKQIDKESSKPVTDSNQTETGNKSEEDNHEEEEDADDDNNNEEDNKNISTYND